MAKDVFHDTVKDALQREGWEILHDPLRIAIGRRQAFIDLGVRDLMTVYKDGIELAVEIKSFLSPSLLEDLYGAIGQYQLYKLAPEARTVSTELYLALPSVTWKIIVDDQIATYISRLQIKLIVFNPLTKQIEQWIN